MNTTMTSRNSGLAVASLVLGILGLLTMVICIGGGLAVIAVILGHVALSQVKKSAGTVTGGGLAIAGLVMGYISIAISLLILPAFLLPAINSAMQRGQMTSTLANGKAIFISVFSRATDAAITDKDSGWPKAADFPTSTAVFTNLVESGAMKVNYFFFSAPGLTPCKGTNATLFNADNNAWCVVADLKDSDPDQTPFLFTRNLRVTDLAQLKGRVGDQLSAEVPYGRQGVVLICKGGMALLVKPDMQWRDVLSGATFTNRVLRP